MPRITRLLEAMLLVDDPVVSCDFYRRVLELDPLTPPSPRGCLFELPGGQVLGLVDRRAAMEPNPTPGGEVPACTPTAGEPVRGAGHVALAIPAEDLDAWRRHLRARRVAVLSQVEWERGGTSLYFRDPDGHLLELATPGVWEIY